MRSSFTTICATLAVVLVLLISVTSAYTTDRRPAPRTCAEASMCCPGQNNTCYVFGQRVDRSEDSSRCYCDSNCIIMGDCCLDYHYHCRSVDCVVNEWGEWSKCSSGCGFGTRTRQRTQLVFPENGGDNCPVLKQRRACVGYDKAECNQNLLGEQEEEKAERARILPRSFGEFRTMKKYDPWKGILKNLYTKYFNEIFTRPSYSSQFRIVSTRRGCQKSDWANVMKVNTTVCVECQPVAMNRDIGMRCLGHGVFNAVTAWKAVDVPHCHGTWQMIAGHEPETCQYSLEAEHKRNFIFL